MLAMQYTIQLPSDYDESLIRKRVEQRGKQFDSLKGMAHKSFLFNAEDKLYAPFYIWRTQQAARSFLLDDLFKGVIDTFNRPRVRTWSVLEATHGAFKGEPTFALREADLIAPEEPLTGLAEKERVQMQALLEDPALAFYVVALDPDRWEFIRYSLWKDEASAQYTGADCVQTYRVLHVSEPEPTA